MTKPRRAPRTPRAPRAAATAVKLAELGVAAPQVLAVRVARMALAGPSPGARDRKEFAGMVLEKQLAFAQAWTGMFAEGMRWQQQFVLSMLTGASPRRHAAQARSAAARIAGRAVGPVHRKAVANARRLARTKLR